MPQRKREVSGKNRRQPPIYRVGRARTGLGLFAAAPISKGTFIIEYWGKWIRSREAEKLNTRYLIELNTRWTIDGADRRNTARYVNHSCKPNAEARAARNAVRIYAIKSIQAGDEITYDYGRRYFEKFFARSGCKCAACAKPRSD